MRKITLGLSLAAMALAGTAGTVYAQQDTGKRDVTVTRAQAQERATAAFTRMDVNKDGKIDQADREARRTAMFDRLDTDKNGQISRAEFAASHPRGPRPEGAAAQAGKPDGKRGGGHWGHRRGHRGGMMMGPGADANKDGAITQAEFTAASLQRFDRLDANKDGQVTKEERQAARTAMREQWKARRDAAKQAPAN